MPTRYHCPTLTANRRRNKLYLTWQTAALIVSYFIFISLGWSNHFIYHLIGLYWMEQIACHSMSLNGMLTQQIKLSQILIRHIDVRHFPFQLPIFIQRINYLFCIANFWYTRDFFRIPSIHLPSGHWTWRSYSIHFHFFVWLHQHSAARKSGKRGQKQLNSVNGLHWISNRKLKLITSQWLVAIFSTIGQNRSTQCKCKLIAFADMYYLGLVWISSVSVRM